MHDIETWILELVTEVYLSMGWPGVVLLMAVESVAFPIPSELVMPLAGWLLVQARGGLVWWVAMAGVYGSLGSLLGAWFVYGVSLKGGRPLLHKYGKYVLITHEELDRAEAWFDKYGECAVFFSRLVPVLRTLISVPAGVSRMNLWEVQYLHLCRLLSVELWPGFRRLYAGGELGGAASGDAAFRITHITGSSWYCCLVRIPAREGHACPTPCRRFIRRLSGGRGQLSPVP